MKQESSDKEAEVFICLFVFRKHMWHLQQMKFRLHAEDWIPVGVTWLGKTDLPLLHITELQRIFSWPKM